MKQYKHKTGKVFTQSENLYYYHNETECVPYYVVENSGDWKEVKEYPKIIAFGTPDIHIYNLLPNGKFMGRCNIECSFNNLINHHASPIYQVAKSETEIFTIGDKVRYTVTKGCAPFVINNFFYDKHENRILARSDINTTAIVEDVTTIEKVKEPLFTTEDGIKLYSGEDKVFGVLPKANWHTNYYGGDGIPVNLVHQSDSSVWKYFSTKESAEKWIDENKPVFSKKEINEIILSLVKFTIRPGYWVINATEFKEKLGI